MNRGGLIAFNFQVQDSQICDLANHISFDTPDKSQIWQVIQTAEKYRLALIRHDFILNVCAQHGHLISKIPNYSGG
jgi:hypothetical protein